jgi:putative NADH-flavin reductase
MRVAIIGASGWLGGAVASEALRRGHQVSAISRNIDGFDGLEGAKRISADATDPAALANAIVGSDVVVCSITDRSTPERSVIPAAIQSLLRALPQAGVERLAVIGGGGSLTDAHGRRLVDDPGFPAEYKAEALAQAKALALLRESDTSVQWTYLSPPPHDLKPGERTGVYRVLAGDRPLSDEQGHSTITSGDLASALVDEIESPQFTRQRFTAAY